MMRVRLVPVGEIFRRMPFVVRDLAKDSGRRIQLELVGQTTEIDKLLIERMMDPVLHLVRNAISHGVEMPEERIAAGKRPDGTIRLAASTVGESVILEVSDDGRGMDVDDVRQRARASGLDVPGGAVDSQVLLDVICAPGFSTRDEADRASGRGVGMAVVRERVAPVGRGDKRLGAGGIAGRKRVDRVRPRGVEMEIRVGQGRRVGRGAEGRLERLHEARVVVGQVRELPLELQRRDRRGRDPGPRPPGSTGPGRRSSD